MTLERYSIQQSSGRFTQSSGEMRGAFVSFEGIDGSGKTSCAKWFAGQIGAHYTYEPGGTPEGRQLREMIFSKQSHGISDVFLFTASRAILVEEVVKPITEAGVHVVCDRFMDSTTAYQHYGLGVPLPVVQTLNLLSVQGWEPDITFLLDIDPRDAMDRMAGNSAKFENLDLLFKVRDGYLAVAQEYHRIQVIDAKQPLEQVQAQVLQKFIEFQQS